MLDNESEGPEKVIKSAKAKQPGIQGKSSISGLVCVTPWAQVHWWKPTESTSLNAPWPTGELVSNLW